MESLLSQTAAVHDVEAERSGVAGLATGKEKSAVLPPRYERVVGHLVGAQPGPTLICVASVHGNEPAGYHGARRVLAALAIATEQLRGSLLVLAGNLKALAAGRRYLEEDLNRIWLSERLAVLRAGAPPSTAEEEELRALDCELRAAVDAATGPVFVIDLHTTSAPGPAFVVLNDTLPNRAFALQLPTPVVLGLEEELSGTLLGYLSTHADVTSIGFESGQHDEPAAVDKAAAAIWLALEASGVVDARDRAEVQAAHELLAGEGSGLPHMVDVHYRHPVEPGDDFRMLPGFVGFQPVHAGMILAYDRNGPVRAPLDGLILMPLYQGQGDDGFFIVRPVRRLWLRLSTLLRRLHLEGYLHWLPGIRRHPEIPDALLVDRRVARVLALQLFHLLGFSRVGPGDGRYLVMRRRAFDR
ncbi:MAG: aspartoacylase [Acidobacteria bacterium]|nr:MAG: aspartoacylase [Acidobacteriota bacterium]